MINLVVALLPEARPLIRFFKLKKTEKEPYALYENGDVRLILSGIGKLNAASAVTSLIHLRPLSKEEAWLNIGLAGHPTFPIETGCLVSKISDISLKRVFYPAFVFDTALARAPLISLDQPSQDYLKGTLYDMEAYGYYFAAIKYALMERIHSYKIISDNERSSIHQINPTKAESLVEAHLPEVSIIVEQLKELTPKLKKHPELSLFLKRWHFSETEKHRLKRALDVLFEQTPHLCSFDRFQSIESPRELLGTLNTVLQRIPL